jgi:hypothetical protein
MPFASVNTLRFVPRLARSVGLGPVFFPSKRRLRHCTVHRQPAPVQANELIVEFERLYPRALEHTGFGPFNEASMRRRARADVGRVERVPLAARPQHEEDGVHSIAVWHPWVMAAERMRLARRE